MDMTNYEPKSAVPELEAPALLIYIAILHAPEPVTSTSLKAHFYVTHYLSPILET
jgi:hypothetical protein